ncbi:MAG: hypothetical protein HYY84_11235 [Deltaproteobacteria bacterium]|nr:hypothetical protein [Deltaproteobacteria bacterium]
MTENASNPVANYAVGAAVSPSGSAVGSSTELQNAALAPSRMGRIVAVGFIAIVGLTLLLVAARLDFVRASYDLAAEERSAERLLEERRHLVVERASLRSPARLAVEAATRSTLLWADVDQWVKWPNLGRADRWPW